MYLYTYVTLNAATDGTEEKQQIIITKNENLKIIRQTEHKKYIHYITQIHACVHGAISLKAIYH